MAKTTTETLEDFIKKYTSSGAKSYSDWLSAEGEDDSTYEKAISDASSAYDRALSTYGKRAEALSRKGLLGGGYSDYLDANAYSEMQTARQNDLREKNTSDVKNRIKYSDYLKDYSNERYKKMHNVIEGINENYIGDEEEAYKYALYNGIPSSIAAELSKFGAGISGVNGMSPNQKSKLITTLASNGYSRGNLYYLLTALGMSQNDANELADTIYKLSKGKWETGNYASYFANTVN